MTKLLDFSNVNLKEGEDYRLKDISFSIDSGEKIALIGRSGAGKSSLISLANGSSKATKGEIKWKGIEINSIKRTEKVLISTLWQDIRLIEELNVQQNINTGILGKRNFFWAIRNLIGGIETQRCKLLLKAVGLEEFLIEANINQLSGGQKQRVAIAKLLRQPAKLMLLDEPLLNLDPVTSLDILNLLLSNKNNIEICIPKTCLVSLHQPELVKRFSRVIGINKGKLVLDIAASDFGISESKLVYHI